MTLFSNFDPLLHFGYAGIFIALSFAGYFIPLPEEVILLTVGYLASAGQYRLIVLIPFTLAALILGDSALYWLSRQGSRITQKLIHHVSRSQYDRFHQIYLKNSGRAVFFARLVVGLRFLSPFLAGSEKLPFLKFLCYDLLALVLYVPALVYLGFRFHAHFAGLLADAMLVRHVIFLTFLIAVSFGIGYYLRHRFYVKKQDERSKK